MSEIIAHCSNPKCDYTFPLPDTIAVGVAWKCPKCYGMDYHVETTTGTVERPFVVQFSEHDLRHIRVILKRWAIQQTDWAQVRCAVGIYDRINEQLSEEEKAILSGPPKPQRDRIAQRRKQP